MFVRWLVSWLVGWSVGMISEKGGGKLHYHGLHKIDISKCFAISETFASIYFMQVRKRYIRPRSEA